MHKLRVSASKDASSTTCSVNPRVLSFIVKHYHVYDSQPQQQPQQPYVASARQASGNGEVVQVDHMKPKLKPPGTKRLKLKSEEPLSTVAFKFNLRRYIMAALAPTSTSCWPKWAVRRLLHRGRRIPRSVACAWTRRAAPCCCRADTRTCAFRAPR